MDEIYYHGSRHNSLAHLDIAFSSGRNPFGPAIYLTKEKAVASFYTGSGGVIYCVRVAGDDEYTINLDEGIERQSKKAIDAIHRLSKIHYKNVDIMGQNARGIIHPDCERRAFANSFLRNRGIWMFYGHLDGMEDSGLMDRGIQYAVINNANITITSSLSRYEICSGS